MDRNKLEEILQKDKVEMIELLEGHKDELFELIPELEKEYGFNQNNPWHIYNVWNHTLVAMGNSPKDLDLRLSLLLHDIGKPISYQDDENGIRHFKGHPEEGEKISRSVLIRLGYDDQMVGKICFLIKNHATDIDVKKINSKNLELMKKLLTVQYCDASAYHPDYVPVALEKLDVIKDNLLKKEKSILDDKIK